MQQKILLGYPLKEKTMARLRELTKHYLACVSGKKDTYDEVCDMIADFDALIVLGHKADKNLIEKGQKLKVISNHGVGYDNVDVAYAKERGIAVTNLPNSTSAPTANMAIGLMLSLLLKITLHDRMLRAGKLPVWNLSEDFGTSPAKKRLGIIGMGRIGKAVATRALALGMEICYFKRSPLPEEEEQKYQAQYMELDELVSTADIITLHTPLNDSTYHLMGSQEIAQMKSSAFLINTARGNVVDNDALIVALQENRIAGAGLDVFPDEPQIPEAYLTMDNVVLTPHAGTATKESRREMFQEAFQNALDVLAGKNIAARVV